MTEFGSDHALIRWHIDRYDRLRSSTSSRAGTVLSASAILSAGNALVLSQLLPPPANRDHRITLALVAVTVLGTVLIVLALVQASNVLLTWRSGRSVFDPAGVVPPAMVFSASDTVRQLKTFAEFQQVVRSQGNEEVVAAAEVELWFCIQQHRRRYAQLRRCTRTLRYAGVVFLSALLAFALISVFPR